MISYENEIDKLCKLIFTFTNVDTIFIDYLSNIKIEFGYNNVPQALIAYFGNINEILKLSDLNLKQDAEISMALIEERYNAESKLMSAVENGDLKSLGKYLSEDLPLFSKIPDRLPNDPLRSRKNLSFVWNTLLRVAARKGGVHPINLHALSQKFAIQIEKTTTISELLDLQREMALSYCNTVNKLSLKKYNYIVREAIEYIRVNLDQDLNLEDISNAIKISQYELSRKFKKETGVAITEYINKLRINEALSLLENGNISITDIAQMIGFNDVNYFTKVFKKLQGITPSEYKKK